MKYNEFTNTIRKSVPRPRPEAHVVLRDRCWEVVEPGMPHHAPHSRQLDAIYQATDLLRQKGGGEVVIHGKNGLIRESRIVNP